MPERPENNREISLLADVLYFGNSQCRFGQGFNRREIDSVIPFNRHPRAGGIQCYTHTPWSIKLGIPACAGDDGKKRGRQKKQKAIP
jgi:hypothetical protein